jgi:glucose-1-phosphate cytidylyltransferase
MKVVILAGGLGTRMAEYTNFVPKPMVKLGNKPILEHLIDIYSKSDFNDFIIALGYKGEIIKDHFKKFKKKNVNIDLIDTGQNTMTGGRLKRIKEEIGNNTFMLTYGDGLSNVDLKKLLSFHVNNKKLVTVTAVRPPARFGYIKFKDDDVVNFKEKSKLDVGWINGGFFVMEPKFLDYIKDDTTYLEREPMEKLVNDRQLAAYKHEGFWQCIDTARDKNLLEDLIKQNNAPWL